MSKLIDIQSVCRKLSPIICDALPGYHAVMGCYTVFSLELGVLQDSNEFAAILPSLCYEFTISNDLIKNAIYLSYVWL